MKANNEVRKDQQSSEAAAFKDLFSLHCAFTGLEILHWSAEEDALGQFRFSVLFPFIFH